jgi:hypothetical protein
MRTATHNLGPKRVQNNADFGYESLVLFDYRAGCNARDTNARASSCNRCK